MLLQKKALQKKALQKKTLDFCLENQSCDRRKDSALHKTTQPLSFTIIQFVHYEHQKCLQNEK